jgi:hypothetical protein
LSTFNLQTVKMSTCKLLTVKMSTCTHFRQPNNSWLSLIPAVGP